MKIWPLIKSKPLDAWIECLKKKNDMNRRIEYVRDKKESSSFNAFIWNVMHNDDNIHYHRHHCEEYVRSY
jgi:hypothetical protein